MNAPPAHEAARRAVLRFFLAALLSATVLPAALGWRLITAYAALPEIRATPVRMIPFASPAIPPPVSGWGIAVAPEGAVFVSDLSGGRLLAFPNATEASGLVLAAGAGEEALTGYALALSPDGRVAFLDSATGRVHVFGSTGRLLGSLPLGSPGARSLAIDDDGSLYVGDSGVALVRKYLPGGRPDVSWGDPSTPGCVRLSVVSLAAKGGKVYAATPRGFSILDERGKVALRRPLMGSATALAAGPNGDIYASDISTDRVWVYSAEGRIRGRVVAAGGREDLFSQPRGLAVPRKGSLYVVNDRGIGIYALAEPPGRP
jgi:sugar lactone lactonase YvrE